MRLINRDELNERLVEAIDRIKSKGAEPTWDDAMYVIDMVDDVDANLIIRNLDDQFENDDEQIERGVGNDSSRGE